MPTSSPNSILVIEVSDHFDGSTRTGATDKVARMAACHTGWSLKTAAGADLALLGEVNLGDIVTKSTASSGPIIDGTACKLLYAQYEGNATEVTLAIAQRIGSAAPEVAPDVTIDPTSAVPATFTGLALPSLDHSVIIRSNGTGGETIRLCFQSVPPETDFSTSFESADGDTASVLLTPAADAAVALTSLTGGVQLTVTAAATVAISTTNSTAGQVIDLFAVAVSGGGSYTLALDTGTLTLNATGEGATVMRNTANTDWVVTGLSGATIV